MKYEEIEKIWIEAEEWCDGFSTEDENSDVNVIFLDGSKWMATFFTISNVNRLMNEWYKNESERHFWASDMIIVSSFGREAIEGVIRKMIEEENFENAFCKSIV